MELSTWPFATWRRQIGSVPRGKQQQKQENISEKWA